MSIVYVLRCINPTTSQPKFYIGRTDHFHDRMTSHFGGRGSQWTKLYKPQDVVYQKKSTDPFEEDILTLKYMEKHGIENVRGGSFANPKLFPSQLFVISRMLLNATGKSFYCKPEMHFNPNFDHKKYPENHYKTWTTEEKEKLQEEKEKGTQVEEIARILKRTTKSVIMQMEKFI